MHKKHGLFSAARRLSVATAVVLAGSAVSVAVANSRPPIVQSPEVTVLQPAVIVAIQGTRYLVYELHLTNLGTAEVALTRIEVADAERGAVLGELRDAALQAALDRPGLAKGTVGDSRTVGPGLRAVFLAWLPLSGAAPAALTHRIDFETTRAGARVSGTVRGPRTEVRREPAVVLGPPVERGRWVAMYGPQVERGHRRFIYTIDGRARIPARFATDWRKLGDDNAFTRGDPTAVTSFHAYGARVLAVADATVAEVRDDVVEDTPVVRQATPVPLEDATGNLIVLELGSGQYAHYEHLKPGSVRVRPGDRVKKGDVIGLLGNTGSSSSGPHLHFHVADSVSSLGAEGLPYVFERFDALGEYQFPTAGDPKSRPRISPLPRGVAAPRRLELPAPNAVVRF